MGPQAQVVARAMQQYGLVLADNGGAMYVTGAPAAVGAGNQVTLVWDMADVAGLSSLNAGMFDVVDLRPRVTGLSASGGPAGATVTVTGQNFSGSSGRLSVFFGSAASAPATYADESHLTAAVAAGAGTVLVASRAGTLAPNP